MNTLEGRETFKKFRILLYSEFISTILIVRIIKRLTPKEDNEIQWHTKSGSITTNTKVKKYFTLPELITTKIVMRNCHVDDSAKGIYNMILGIDILTALVLNLKLSDKAPEIYYGPFKRVCSNHG